MWHIYNGIKLSLNMQIRIEDRREKILEFKSLELLGVGVVPDVELVLEGVLLVDEEVPEEVAAMASRAAFWMCLISATLLSSFVV